MRARQCLVGLVGLAGLTAGLHAQTPQADIEVIRVGYTTWSTPETAAADLLSNTEPAPPRSPTQWRELNALKRFLTAFGAQHPTRQLRFEITAGNYYQVHTWFRRGLLDMAVSTPFVANLLEREGLAKSEWAVFTTQNAGYWPVLWATGPRELEPERALDEFLSALWASPETKQPVRLNFVNHLSASGFVVPVASIARWLNARPGGDSERRAAFWDGVFSHAVFWSDRGQEFPAPASVQTVISFGVCSRFKEPGGSVCESDEARGKRAVRYLPVADRAVPTIPTNVLAISPRLLRDSGSLVDAVARALPRVGATSIAAPSIPVRSSFRNDVLLFEQALASQGRFDRWYKHGRYDFSISETLQFLKQDQLNSGTKALSMVLSGGGVKSIFQAHILDELYFGQGGKPGALQNHGTPRERAVSGASTPAKPPLEVTNVIGTSGGAIMALFASLLGQPRGPTSMAAIAEGLASRDVFPLFDLPRMLSVLLLCVILQCVWWVCRALNICGLGHRVQTAAVKTALSARLFALLLVFPLAVLIPRFSRGRNYEAVFLVEGVVFAMTLLAAHLVWTSLLRVDRAGRRRVERPEWYLLAAGSGLLGLVMIAAPFAIAYSTDGYGQVLSATARQTHAPLMTSLGVLLLPCAFLMRAAASPAGWTFSRLTAYRHAMGVVVAYVLTCYLVLWILSFLKVISLLEVTPGFWIALVVVGISVAAIIPRIAAWARWPGPWLHQGISALLTDRVGGHTGTMLSRWVFGGTIALVAWVGVVAPAAYGNQNAIGAVYDVAKEQRLLQVPFQANLIVTGSLLNRTGCENEEAVHQNGLYLCYDGVGKCPAGPGGRWFKFRGAVPAGALDGVFASGSPFPAFPPHRTALPNNCEVRLVDGGYAHNIPLDAAQHAGARQVLIVNASPEPDEIVAPTTIKSWILSQLVRETGRVLSFMWTRAQDLDQTASESLFVATLSPPADPEWPFLLDFRKSVRTHLADAAKHVLADDSRIGHVISWGVPKVIYVVGPVPRLAAQ